jgi:hypothetical protein
MRLEPLYRMRFRDPEEWGVALEGGWEQYLFLAEGRCDGGISGRLRGANFPQRRTGSGPFCPDFRGVIETDDGATVLFELRGYGRAYPPGRRQVVGSALHLSDTEPYRRLNDVVCVCVGEVRAGAGAADTAAAAAFDPAAATELALDVAELVWEPIAE